MDDTPLHTHVYPTRAVVTHRVTMGQWELSLEAPDPGSQDGSKELWEGKKNNLETETSVEEEQKKSREGQWLWWVMESLCFEQEIHISRRETEVK